MTSSVALDILDQAAARLVGAYRDLGKVATVMRGGGAGVQVIALDGADAETAKLLYASADTFADRAFYKAKEVGNG